MSEQITIIKFWKDISKILQEYREQQISYRRAKSEIQRLNAEATKAGLGVSIPESYIDKIEMFDDEMSYEEEESYNSYESDEDNEN